MRSRVFICERSKRSRCETRIMICWPKVARSRADTSLRSMADSNSAGLTPISLSGWRSTRRAQQNYFNGAVEFIDTSLMHPVFVAHRSSSQQIEEVRRPEGVGESATREASGDTVAGAANPNARRRV